jgi:hypothetical protein
MKFSLLLLSILSVFIPFFAEAQQVKVPVPTDQTSANQTSQADALPEYKGVEDSIRRFLCAPADNNDINSDTNGDGIADYNADGTELSNCINRLYRFGAVAGAFGAVLVIVLAGYYYIVLGEKGKTEGKNMIISVIAGLLIIFTAYILLRQINPEILQFRSIQPPRLEDVGALPSCANLKLGDDCTIAGRAAVSDGKGGSLGEKVACPDGLVSAKSLGLPTKAGDEQICKSFGQKLLGLKNSLGGLSWRITDTIGPGHSSQCHASGNPYSGTCADIGYGNTTERTDANWNKMCDAVKAVGLFPHNEASAQATRCPTFDPGTDPHIHVIWLSGASTSSSDSNSKSGLPGVIAYTGNPHVYPNSIWDNTKPELRQAAEKFRSNWGKDIAIRQVYRPKEYGDHLRSVWEAYQLVWNGKDDNYVKTTGYKCSNRSSSFVTSAQAKTYTSQQKEDLKKEYNQHFGSSNSPTTCDSDHAQGIAFDVHSSSLPGNEADFKKFMEAAYQAGLCHHIPNDLPHFALRQYLPAGTNCHVYP